MELLAMPDTLVVRRLPEALTERDLNELFHYFGGIEARRETPKGIMRRSTVYVKFKSHEDASFALTRLHQLVVMGERIVVEFADFTFLPDCPSAQQNIIPPTKHDTADDHQWKFPTANPTIVKNIASVLRRNEEFYRRVLQLMKRMNLPPPFSDEEDEKVQTTEIQSTEIEEVEMEELYKEDTEESELELDETLIPGQKLVIPERPLILKKLKKQINPRKKLTAMKPTISKAKSTVPSSVMAITEVFEKTEVNSGKKLEVKISSSELNVQEGPSLKEKEESSNGEGFGTFAPVPLVVDNASENLEKTGEDNQEYITVHKLQINKLQEEEMKLQPVFKNYSKGIPNSRLYVKNLSKTVKESDLKHIYGRYVVWTNEEECNMFDIRLMTTGRMKGQAFITLPSVVRAEKALDETNGVMLQGKPLVVTFARSAQSKT